MYKNSIIFDYDLLPGHVTVKGRNKIRDIWGMCGPKGRDGADFTLRPPKAAEKNLISAPKAPKFKKT